MFLEDQVGSLEEGKLADLIVLDTRPADLPRGEDQGHAGAADLRQRQAGVRAQMTPDKASAAVLVIHRATGKESGERRGSSPPREDRRDEPGGSPAPFFGRSFPRSHSQAKIVVSGSVRFRFAVTLPGGTRHVRVRRRNPAPALLDRRRHLPDLGLRAALSARARPRPDDQRAGPRRRPAAGRQWAYYAEFYHQLRALGFDPLGGYHKTCYNFLYHWSKEYRRRHVPLRRPALLRPGLLAQSLRPATARLSLAPQRRHAPIDGEQPGGLGDRARRLPPRRPRHPRT